MIRPALLKAISAALQSHSYLSQEDFITREFKNRVGNPAIEIKYRYNTTLFFRFGIPTTRTDNDEYIFHVTVQPGHESIEESLSTKSRSGLTSELREWLDRLYEDIVSLPIVRQLQEHARTIDQLKERLETLPDEPISQTDIETYREDLEKLKAELFERLEKEVGDTEQLKTKVDDLTRDIDFLKATLNSMTKRKWGELLFSRLHKWSGRVTWRQISAGTKTLKLLIPSETADAVDAVAQEIADTAELNPRE